MNKKDRKTIDYMLDHLEKMIGPFETGRVIAILCDSFDNYANGQERSLRTMKITFNGFFETEFDFETGKYAE